MAHPVKTYHFTILSVVLIILLYGFNCFSINHADNLKNKLYQTTSDTVKIELYNELFYHYEYHKPESAKLYIDTALIIAKQKNLLTYQAKCLVLFGFYEDDRGNYFEAIQYYNEAISLYKKGGLAIGIADCYNNIGLIYTKLGNYSSAFDNFQNSLNLSLEIDNKTGVAKCYNHLGSISKYIGNLEDAMTYYEKSVDIYDKINDRSGKAGTLSNIALLYFEKGDFVKALMSQNISLRIHEEIEDKYGLSTNYSNIGDIYFEKKHYSEAINYYKKALEIEKQLSDHQGMAISFTSIGKTYFAEGEIDKSEFYVKEGLALSTKFGLKQQTGQAYKLLSQLYAAKEDFKSAYRYRSLYGEAHDSLFNEKMSSQIAEMKTKFEFEEKEKLIQIKNAQIAQKDSSVKQQTTLKYTFVVGFVFMFVIVVILYKNNTLKKAASESISLQNQKIANSMLYAQRIQQAILPSQKDLENILPQNFLFFKPREMVSGDFYLIKDVNDYLILAVADCTGHGVAGGLLSMLGVAFLNEIILRNDVYSPDYALNNLRDNIKSALNQRGDIFEAKEGIDMSLCAINKQNNTLDFAGAYNIIYIMRDGKINEYKGDKMPIGIHPYEKDSFTNNRIQLKPNDIIYMFTDGFIDQIGGPEGKRFNSLQFKSLLLKIHNLTMPEQKKALDKAMNEWMRKETIEQEPYEQVDDMLILGFKWEM